MNWRAVDWTWVWILAALCALLGAVQAFDDIVDREVPLSDYQSFWVLLKENVSPADKAKLWSQLTELRGVHQVKWLEPREILTLVFRQALSEEEAALIQEHLPEVAEVLVPTSLLVGRAFNPTTFLTFSQVERYQGDEDAISAVQSERARWHLRSQQIQLILILASILIVAASFLVTSQRNQLGLSLERSGTALAPGVAQRLNRGALYGGTGSLWLKIMGIQAAAAVVLTVALFLAFSVILTAFGTSPTISLATVSNWRFLWVAGGLGAIGKGLDLLRVSLRSRA